MRIFPIQETMAERVSRGVSGEPEEKALLQFLLKTKQYASIPELSDRGVKLVWVEGGSQVEIPVGAIWDDRYKLCSSKRLWFPDKKLGKVNALFNYEGEDTLRLEFTPEVVRGRITYEKPRRNIHLTLEDTWGRIPKGFAALTLEDAHLRLPSGFFLLRY